eukprot:2943444-Rhodomonas_salina.1
MRKEECSACPRWEEGALFFGRFCSESASGCPITNQDGWMIRGSDGSTKRCWPHSSLASVWAQSDSARHRSWFFLLRYLCSHAFLGKTRHKRLALDDLFVSARQLKWLQFLPREERQLPHDCGFLPQFLFHSSLSH